MDISTKGKKLFDKEGHILINAFDNDIPSKLLLLWLATHDITKEAPKIAKFNLVGRMRKRCQE